MRNLTKLPRLGLVAALMLSTGAARAEDAFYRVPLADIPAAQEVLSQPRQPPDWRTLNRSQWIRPYAALNGEGEVYVNASLGPGGAWPVDGRRAAR